MVLQEPKVEFVSIALANMIVTSTGGGQYCVASQENAQYCPNWNNDVDWANEMPSPSGN